MPTEDNSSRESRGTRAGEHGKKVEGVKGTRQGNQTGGHGKQCHPICVHGLWMTNSISDIELQRGH